MQCTNCQSELLPGKKFCPACGARVTTTCTQCGAPLDAGFRFCPDCGAPIGPASESPPATAADNSFGRLAQQMPEGLAQKIRAGKDAIAGERKQVTVLFCDLVGSTAMAEQLDPEEYHDLLEQYLEIAFRKIYRFEGIVNQLAGDGMMALFGAPVAHEDAPQRAVLAALAVRNALERFNQERSGGHRLELRARFGINTGPVVVGTVGNDLKMDYTAIGDTTNLAARLEALAAPGAILISDITSRLVRGLFEMRAVGPFDVKGKREPVVAYEILGVVETSTPMDIAAERGLTPFVGRGEEIAQLQACYHRLAGKLPQVVAVVGDAGCGKSRLLYEFRRWLTEQSAVIFEARCSALNQMVPYFPWIAMLKQYFGVLPGEPSGGVCDKVGRRLREVDPGLKDAAPLLCHLLGVAVAGIGDEPSDELKRDTFAAVEHLVRSESQRGPVVVIIEDLHWIDEPAREMLERAVTRLGKGPVMFLVSHRPDYHQVWRTPAAFTQLNLRSLSDDDARQIVRALAGAALPAELEQLILTKAEGSPFFAEEITRTLLEGGYLTRNNGQHQLTRPIEEIRIPGTVQEVIAARLDRLGADAKRVLQVAAVIGRQFSRGHLEQLLGPEGVDVEPALHELEHRGVIHRKNLFSDDEFRFGESLTQEVAYESLLLKQRRQLHERIGALLEASGGAGSPERSALLAHHFAHSENRHKAIAALLGAARDAERVPSYRTAARFYREAWDLAESGHASEPGHDLDRLALAAAVGLCRMTVIYVAPAPGDAQEVARRARDLAATLGDSATLASLCTYHGMMMTGDRTTFAEGVSLVEQGLAIAERAGVSGPAMSRGLAWTYLLDGRFALAQRTIEWVVAELEHPGEAERLSDIYLSARVMQARMRYYSDDLAGAMRGAAETYELAVRASNRTIQSGTSATMAHICLVRGAYAEAKRYADRSLEMAEAVGALGTMRTEAAVALVASVELREPTAVTRYVDLINPRLAPEGDSALSTEAVTDALLLVGELHSAEQFARLAHDRASGRLREMLSTVTLANVLLHLGPLHWPEAARHFEEAIAVSESLGARTTLALARLGAAELAAARGDRDTCLRQLEHALSICRDLGLGRYQARAERLLAGLEAVAERHA